MSALLVRSKQPQRHPEQQPVFGQYWSTKSSQALRFLIATSAGREASNERRSGRRQRADQKGSTPGRELLAAAGHFHRMRAEDKAFWKVTKDDPGNKHADAFNQPDGLLTRIGGAVQRVSEMIRQQHSTQLEEGCEDEEIVVALSLVRDVLGRADA